MSRTQVCRAISPHIGPSSTQLQPIGGEDIGCTRQTLLALRAWFTLGSLLALRALGTCFPLRSLRTTFAPGALLSTQALFALGTFYQFLLFTGRKTKRQTQEAQCAPS